MLKKLLKISSLQLFIFCLATNLYGQNLAFDQFVPRSIPGEKISANKTALAEESKTSLAVLISLYKDDPSYREGLTCAAQKWPDVAAEAKRNVGVLIELLAYISLEAKGPWPDDPCPPVCLSGIEDETGQMAFKTNSANIPENIDTIDSGVAFIGSIGAAYRLARSETLIPKVFGTVGFLSLTKPKLDENELGLNNFTRPMVQVGFKVEYLLPFGAIVSEFRYSFIGGDVEYIDVNNITYTNNSSLNWSEVGAGIRVNL